MALINNKMMEAAAKLATAQLAKRREEAAAQQQEERVTNLAAQTLLRQKGMQEAQRTATQLQERAVDRLDVANAAAQRTGGTDAYNPVTGIRAATRAETYDANTGVTALQRMLQAARESIGAEKTKSAGGTGATSSGGYAATFPRGEGFLGTESGAPLQLAERWQGAAEKFRESAGLAAGASELSDEERIRQEIYRQYGDQRLAIPYYKQQADKEVEARLRLEKLREGEISMAPAQGAATGTQEATEERPQEGAATGAQWGVEEQKALDLYTAAKAGKTDDWRLAESAEAQYENKILAEMERRGLEPIPYSADYWMIAEEMPANAREETAQEALQGVIAEYEQANPETAAEYREIYERQSDLLTKTWFNPFDVAGTQEQRELIQRRIREGYASPADQDREAPSLVAGLAELDKQDQMRANPRQAIEEIDKELARLEELRQTEQWRGNGQLQQNVWDLERQKALLEGYAALNEAGEGAELMVKAGQSRYQADGGGWLYGGNVQSAARAVTGLGGNAAGMMEMEDISQSAMMTEEERNAYFVLYATKGRDAANEYLDALSMSLNERVTQGMRENVAQQIDEHPVAGGILGAVADIALEPTKILTTSALILSHLTGKEIDPNDLGFYSTMMQSAIKEETNAAITKANGGQKTIWNEIYDLAMNIAENGSRMLISKQVLPSSWLSTAAMAYGSMSNYFADAANQVSEKDQNKLMLTAGLEAISEFLTELLSDAHMWNAMSMDFSGKSGWKKAGMMAWNTLVGSFAEGITETLNDEITTQIQNYVLQDESAYNRDVERYVREYLRTGEYTDSQKAYEAAYKAAGRDHIKDLMHTFLVSMISGGVMDLGGMTYGQYAQRQAEISQGIDERVALVEQEQAREEERKRNSPEAREQRRHEQAAESINMIITPQYNAEYEQNGPKPQARYKASELVAAERAYKEGYAVAMAPDGTILIGETNAATYLMRGLEGENVQNNLQAFRRRRGAEMAIRRQRAGADAALQNAGQDINRTIVPEEQNGQRVYKEEDLRAAEEAKGQGIAVGLAPDGTITIGITNTRNYLINHLAGIKLDNEARGQARGDRRLSPSQINHRNNQAETVWNYDKALERYEEYLRQQGKAVPEVQESPWQQAQAGLDNIMTNAEMENKWDYNTALQRWQEYRKQWAKEEEKAPERKRPELILPQRVQDEEETGNPEDAVSWADWATDEMKAAVRPTVGEESDRGGRGEQERERRNEEREREERRGREREIRGEEEQEEQAEQPARGEEERAAIRPNVGENSDRGGRGEQERERRNEEREREERRGREREIRGDEEEQLPWETEEEARARQEGRTQDGGERVAIRPTVGEDSDRGGRGEEARERIAEEREREKRLRTVEVSEEAENAPARAGETEADAMPAQEMDNRQRTHPVEPGNRQQGEREIAPEAETADRGENAAETAAAGEQDTAGRATGEQAETQEQPARDRNREPVPPVLRDVPSRTVTGQEVDAQEREEKISSGEWTAQTVGEVVVTEDRNGERTVAMPEGKEQDEDLTEQVLLAVGDAEAAAAVTGLVNEDWYRRKHRPIPRMINLDEDSGPVIIERHDGEETREIVTEAQKHLRPLPITIDEDQAEQIEDEERQREIDARAAETAYHYGRTGASLDVMRGLFKDRANRELLEKAHELGRQQREKEQQRRQQRNRDLARRYGFAAIDDDNGDGFRNRVIFDDVTNELDERQEKQLRILEEIGYQYGLSFHVYDSLGDSNARYNGNTHQIDLALDADDGAIVRAASHEVYHYIEQWNAEGAERLANAVMAWLDRDPNYNAAQRMADITRRYARSGADVDARSELVADSMLDMLATPQAIVTGVGETDVRAGQMDMTAIGRHIQEMGEWLRNTIRRVAEHSPEARALLNQQEYIQTVGDMLVKEAKRATAARRQMTYGLSPTLRESSLVEAYYKVVERGLADPGKLYDAARKIGYGALQQAYGKDFMKEWMMTNALTQSDAEAEIERILQEYTDGTKSLDKALQDAELPAVEEGEKRDGIVFAARQLENARGREGTKEQQETKAREPEYQYSKKRDEWTMEDFERDERNVQQISETLGNSMPEAHFMFKLYQTLKEGVLYNMYGHTVGEPRLGGYDIKALAQEIKNEFPKGTPGELRMSSEYLEKMLRGLYVSLDEALARGDEFDFHRALSEAETIAEEIADKCGQSFVDTYEELGYERPIDQWMKENQGSVIYLDEGQASEAREIYKSIPRLNRHYRGVLSFTLEKRAGVQYLEDIAAEHPDLLKEWNAGNLFTELDDLIEHWRERKRGQAGWMSEKDYNGLTRKGFVRDMGGRILLGWFGATENGIVGQVQENGSRTKAQAEYQQAIKEAVKHYHDRERELAKEYEQRIRANERTAQKEYEQKLQQAQWEYRDKLRDEMKEDREWIEKNKGAIFEAHMMQRTNEAVLNQEKARIAAELTDYISRIDQERAAERQRMEAEMKQKEKRLKAMALVAANDRMRTELEKRISRYRDSMRRTQLQKRAEQTVKKLADMLLHPTNDKHVPEDLRKAVAQALGVVERGGWEAGGKTMEFAALRSAIQNVMNEEGSVVVPDPDLDSELNELATMAQGRTLLSMDTDTLEAVVDALEKIHHMLDTAGKSVALKRGQDLQALQAEMAARAQEADPEIKGPAVRAIERQIQGNLMDPIRFFTRMERQCGHIGRDVWQMLRKALDRQITDTDTAELKFGEALAEFKNYWKWTGRNAQTIKSGDITMTAAQAMTLYKYMQRPDAVRHVLGEANSKGEMIGGGIYIDYTRSGKEKFRTNRPVKVTMQQVQEIISQLTDEQKKCADALGKLMSTWCADLGNEVSMDLYGYKKYKDKNYVPIKVAPGFTSQTMGEDTGNVFYLINNKGWTKNLMEHATAPVVINDIFSLTGQHTMEMITYHAWGREMADLARLINIKHSDTEQIMERGRERDINKQRGGFAMDMRLLMGDNAMPYFRQLLKDINGLSKDSIERSGISGMLSKYKGAAVSFNLSTAAKQPLSFIRAFDVIPARYWAGVVGKGMGIADVKKNLNELDKFSKIYKWKQRGNFVLDAGASFWDILYPETNQHGIEGVMSKASEIGMTLPGLMDNWTWANIWSAAKAMTEATHKEVEKGSAKYWDLVVERFNDCIDRTQVVDSILHRTQIMRGQTEFIKMITSFMGEPMKTLNTALDKLDAYRENKTKKNATALVRTAGLMAASGVLQAVISSFVGALRKMKEPEDFQDDFLRRLLGDYENLNGFQAVMEALFGNNLASEVNPLNQIPLVRDVTDIMAGYEPDRSDLSVVSDLYNAMSNWYAALFDDSKKTVAQTTAGVFSATANLLGMPIGNIVKEAEYLTNWVPKVLEQLGVDTWLVQYWRMRYEENIAYGKTKTVMNDYIEFAQRAKAAGNDVVAQMVLDDLQKDGGWDKTDVSDKWNKTTLQGMLADGAGDNKAGYYSTWAKYEAAGDVDKAKAALSSIEGLKSSTEDVEKNKALFLVANKYGIEISSLNTAQSTVFGAWYEAKVSGDTKTATGIINMLKNHGYTDDKISSAQKAAEKKWKEQHGGK